jgi:hypothetical protein
VEGGAEGPDLDPLLVAPSSINAEEVPKELEKKHTMTGKLNVVEPAD